MVIMKDMSTCSIIQGLETLQQLRGALLNIVLDAHKSHLGLLNDRDQDRWSVLHRLLQGNTKLLGSAGIKLTIAAAKRHEKVGRAEHMISKVKRILLSVVKSYCFKDYYNLQHKISLIQLMLNERPTFLHGGRILTPLSIDSALM